MTDISVQVQAGRFDPGAELNAFTANTTAIGAVASFVGLVRDLNLDHAVAALHLEHYPGMTEQVLLEIAGQASQRWALQRLRVIHRFGDLLPGDPIVMVLTASPHRGEALEACAFVMDFLKTQAPFWKRESTPAGPRWVDARASDDHALGRWQAGKGVDHG